MAKKSKKVNNASLFGESAKTLDSKNKVQINWMWWALMIFVVGFFVFYFIFSKIGTFEYQELAFDKQGYGKELVLYHHSYLFNFNDQTYKQNIYLRHDPRENNVPVEDKILSTQGREVYLGINNTNIIDCVDSSIAIGTLSQFLSNPQLVFARGTTDAKEAEEKKQRHVTCEKLEGKNVVIIQSGNETKITKQSESCYIINVNQCEVQPAVEKFIINSLVDARENSLKSE